LHIYFTLPANRCGVTSVVAAKQVITNGSKLRLIWDSQISETLTRCWPLRGAASMGAAVSITRLDLTASELRKAASGEKNSAPARRILAPVLGGMDRKTAAETPSSTTTTISSIEPGTHGITSNKIQCASPQSPPVLGQQSISRAVGIRRVAARIAIRGRRVGGCRLAEREAGKPDEHLGDRNITSANAIQEVDYQSPQLQTFAPHRWRPRRTPCFSDASARERWCRVQLCCVVVVR
jgi:hypothetical protein